MKRRSEHIKFLVFFFCIASSSTSIGQLDIQETGAFGTFYTLERSFDDSTIDGYNLYIPNSCMEATNACPVIIFLQGSGSVGKEVSSIFNWALPKNVRKVKNLNSEYSRLIADTFIIIMPHLREGQYYDNVDAVKTILEEVSEKSNIDRSRIYLTGLSRGGHGTWGLASRMPGVFAAIVPICGRPDGILDYGELRDLPVLAIHNIGDDVVPVQSSIEIIDNLESRFDYDFKKAKSSKEVDFLTDSYVFISPNKKSHDAWTKAYKNPELFKWLLRFQSGQ
jgi:Predicted peptidase